MRTPLRISHSTLLAALVCALPARAATAPTNRPILEPAGGYVSSDTCRSCHPGNYAGWHASFHRTMTQVAAPAVMPASLDGFDRTLDGWRYRVGRAGEKFYLTRTSATGAATEPPRELVLTTGSHTLQIFWADTGEGRTLAQFPFAYIIAEKIWAPVTQTFLLPPEFRTSYTPGEWNGACMDCHVTAGRSRFTGGSTFDSRAAEFGIACEACHGEGRAHIAQNQNPLTRYLKHLAGAGDSSAANPARMRGPESALACGQCHSVWAFEGMEQKLAWNRDGGTFRPGHAGLAERFIVQPAGTDHVGQKQQIAQDNAHYFTDRFWDDGMVRVTGRELNGVMASPCSKGGDFSCLSCHAMHPEKTDPASIAAWRDHQMKPGMSGDTACLQCHTDMTPRLAAHTHHAAESDGSRCYNCHMPHTSYGLLRAIPSHQVSSPTVRESLDHGRPNACNLCHLDRPLAWTAEKLHDWYGQPTPPLAADDREISAAVRWLLAGDAGQRALIAWGMGWAPAQRASGRDWLAPLLALTLNDSYAAVRFDAWKSLQTLPGFASFAYEFTAEETATKAAVTRAYEQWRRTPRPAGAVFGPATLLDSTGRFRQEVITRLLAQRNLRPIFLAE